MSTKTSVLIVDDEKNMRETLADILERQGYEVTTADRAEVAIRLCSRRGFDVILMDVRMPGMDGVEAFRRIRRHQEGVRVILMSAYSVDQLKAVALEEGAIAFLAKPLDLEAVIKLISGVKETAILVVESDEQEAASLKDALEGHGYWVRTTKSPHDALELVEQIRFDIVFIDANLPVMNGLELYLAIKEITPSSVAILITDMNEEFEKLAREAVRRTAYAFLRKPLDLDYMFKLLSRLPGQRASNALRKPAPDDPV